METFATRTEVTIMPMTPARKQQMTSWEPPRPIGTRWQRMTDSVRLVASVAGIVGGGRTAAR